MTALERLHALHQALAIEQTMEVRREAYLEHMTFRANHGPLFTEPFGPIVGLKEEWAAQGATPQELDLSAFRYRRAQAGMVPVNTGWLGGEEDEAILEETPEHIVARDRYGRRVRVVKATATLPLPLDYPVRTFEDWRRIRHHYAFAEERLEPGWDAAARAHRNEGRVVTVTIPGAFDEPRELLGDAALCEAYYTQPALVHDILDTIADMAYQVLDRVSAAVTVDELAVHEDLAGKSGPLIGPRQVREYMLPYYRRLWDLVASRGARLFSLDSDGDVRPIIPDLLAGGVNVLWPNEPAAGMDVVALRARYGTDLAFIGGIDKHVLRRTPAEIETELEYRLPPMVRSGGCVLGLDHRIPNGTPLAHYRFYIAKAWEIMEREAAAL